MKRIEQFKCDYCGVVYADKAECVKCEAQHITCVSIHDEMHMGMKGCPKYPPRVRIKMSDGTIQEYERRRQI